MLVHQNSQSKVLEIVGNNTRQIDKEVFWHQESKMYLFETEYVLL